MLINIEKLKTYFEMDAVFLTEHAEERFRQRGIKISSIRYAVNNGEIIEQYPEDFPFPSCLILGTTEDEKAIHICMSDEGTASRIVTAYFPDKNRWSADFKVRKENAE